MAVSKKIFFISLSLFAISLLLWGVYNLSFKSRQPASEKANQSSSSSNIPSPEINSPKISVVSSQPVLAPALSSDGNKIRYFSKDTGQAFQIDLDGENKEILLLEETAGLSGVSWSYDFSKALLKKTNIQGKINFSLYDFSEKKFTRLNENVDEIAWQTNANRIFYKYFDPKSRIGTLNVSDPDGKNWKKLTDISYRYISISQIPKTGLISFWNSGWAYNETLFQSIPVVGGEIKTLLRGKFGADYLWNNSGNRVLVSHSDSNGGHKMQLAVMNNNGGEYKNLEIPTFISKCVWSENNKTVYYALPGGIPDNSILPNDYKSAKFNTTDTFWKINLETGEKSRLLELGDITGKFDADQMFLNQDESLLFFVDRIDKKLYQISF